MAVRIKRYLPELFAVSRRAGKAIGDYEMIQEGDKVAVAVSGGKDSISLLHVLRHRQSVAPVKFDFAAVHIDFGFSDFNPKALFEYLSAKDSNTTSKKWRRSKGRSGKTSN